MDDEYYLRIGGVARYEAQNMIKNFRVILILSCRGYRDTLYFETSIPGLFDDVRVVIGEYIVYRWVVDN